MPFLPGISLPPSLPLGRYLPPVPEGMGLNWCRQNILPGEWILDPLGSTPQLSLDLARGGYRVLVASNNPILTFMLETLARAPSRAEFESALAELGSVRRGAERLEIHFSSLYQTECAACHQMIQPEAFLWRRSETQPFARYYHCPQCKDEGERPITAGDLERLSLPGNPALHRARALERIALPDDPLRAGAQEIVQYFLPRALYFLTTLINRIEGLATTDLRRCLLIALALSVCDSANSLWPFPEGRSRPRQLTIPPIFRENNLWVVLESALNDWVQPGEPIALTHWPELPPVEGGICLYSGRLKELVPFQPPALPRAVVLILPRPNQAFWTLSAVWSGWLWGRDAVTPLKNALERQRYDWQWHAQALHSVFVQLAHHIPENTPVWGIVPEIVPGFLTAAILAGETGSLHLEGITMRDETELAQLLWKPAGGVNNPAVKSVETILQEAVLATLARAGEPTQYLPLHAAGLVELVRSRRFSPAPNPPSGELLTQIQASFLNVFKTNGSLQRYERQPSQNIETGWWWLSETAVEKIESPLADRIEIELVRWLLKNSGKPFVELENTLAQAFPGLLSPSIQLIEICLKSYAFSDNNNPPGWRLRKAELPATRRQDLETIRRELDQLGKKLDYSTVGEMPLIWQSNQGKPGYALFPIASANISKYVFQPQALPPEHCILVIPGSRVNLILYKLRRDPRLAEAVNTGWRFMKFRQIRQMLDQPDLNPGLFSENLAGDPPRWEDSTQLVML